MIRYYDWVRKSHIVARTGLIVCAFVVARAVNLYAEGSGDRPLSELPEAKDQTPVPKCPDDYDPYGPGHSRGPQPKAPGMDSRRASCPDGARKIRGVNFRIRDNTMWEVVCTDEKGRNVRGSFGGAHGICMGKVSGGGDREVVMYIQRE